MGKKLTPELVQEALNDEFWSERDRFLESLCRDSNPSEEEVAARLLIVGRTYAAPLERFQGAKRKWFHAYRGVAKRLVDKGFLQELGQFDPPEFWSSAATQMEVLRLHRQLIELLGCKKNPRSLASKFMHFHRPDVVLIFDNNARAAASRTMESLRLQVEKLDIHGVDDPYRRYLQNALALKRHIEDQIEIEVPTPRDLDKIIIRLSGAFN